MKSIKFLEINNCSEKQKLILRGIRNQHSVRKEMYTDHEITLEEHLNWLEGLG